MRTTIISLISLAIAGNVAAQRPAMNPSQSMDVNLVSLKINNKSNINMIVLDRVKVSASLKSMVKELTNIKTEAAPNFSNASNTKFVKSFLTDDEHLKEIIFVNNQNREGDQSKNPNVESLQLNLLTHPGKTAYNESAVKEKKETASLDLAKLPIKKSTEMKLAASAQSNDVLKAKSNRYELSHKQSATTENLEQYGYYQDASEEISEIPSQEPGFPSNDIFEKVNDNTDETEKTAFFYEETPVVQEPEVQEIPNTESDLYVITKTGNGYNTSFANFIALLKQADSNNSAIAYTEDPQETAIGTVATEASEESNAQETK